MTQDYVNKEFDKYLDKIDLVDYYITKNILNLIKKKNSYDFIINNPFLLSVLNKSNKNSLIILLDNKQYDTMIELINTNNYLLKIKDYNENTIFNMFIYHEELYDFIVKIISTYDIFLITYLLTIKNINNMTFINILTNLLNENIDNTISDNVTSIFKSIFELDNEKNILLITFLCRDIVNNDLLYNILTKIMTSTKSLKLYCDEYLLNAIDYLLLNNNIKTLDFLVNKVDKIKFCNFQNIILHEFIKNNDKISKSLLDIILKIIDKSDIHKLKDKNNKTILDLLYDKKIDSNILNKYKKLFDAISITKTNEIININLKSILLKLDTNIFSSSPINNMLYTLYILQKYDNVIIPYYVQSLKELQKSNLLIKIANINYNVKNYLNTYFKYYSSFLPHIIIWYNKDNYYIDEHLINFIKNNKNKKRFILIKLTLVLIESSNTKHANYLIVDNKKKIVERFEPFGKITIDNSLDLNKVIQTNICNVIKYNFVFSQLDPGFQVKSDELNIFIRNINDATGYCLAWCYVYIEIKLMFENENTEKLLDNYIINKFEIKIKNDTNKYLDFIRYYSSHLNNEKNKLLSKYGIDEHYKEHIKQNDMIKLTKNINNDMLKINDSR